MYYAGIINLCITRKSSIFWVETTRNIKSMHRTSLLTNTWSIEYSRLQRCNRKDYYYEKEKYCRIIKSIRENYAKVKNRKLSTLDEGL